MAKITGGLFSVSASGKFAKAMVFATWKGRAYARQLITPSNPRSTGQQDSRNAIRVLAAGQKFANATTTMRSGATMTDKAALTAAAPTGQAWNGYLVNSGIGKQALNYAAAESAWTALSSGNKTSWDGAAAALTPPIPAVAQNDAGGVPGTPKTAGNVFFHYEYALFKAGLTTEPSGTPPTYA